VYPSLNMIFVSCKYLSITIYANYRVSETIFITFFVDYCHFFCDRLIVDFFDNRWIIHNAMFIFAPRVFTCNMQNDVRGNS